MSHITRGSALELIQTNITKFGHHIYSVTSGEALPRFSYTIGLSDNAGAELILAGAAFYYADDVKSIINTIATNLRPGAEQQQSAIQIDSLGYFSLRRVDASWSKALMLGAWDFYGNREVSALQIVPDRQHWTVDVPNLEQPWSAVDEPVWQWLHEPWTLPVPLKSVATTNLAALRGEPVTEAARWEEDQWELFAGAGPDVQRKDVRVVPLGTMLAVDPSLNVATDLTVGQAIWRDSNQLEWHAWGQVD